MTIDQVSTYTTIAQNFIVIGGCLFGLYHFLKKYDILHSVNFQVKKKSFF
jgi:hypothetical protein